MRRTKDVLTTGDVAKICKVAPRTVSKWFDSGKLRGYRIPGSKDRRIPVQQLVRFMRAHGIPLNGIETGATRVLIAEPDGELADLLSKALAKEAGYEVTVARTAFEAGALAESSRPHVMLVDVDLPGLSGRDAVRTIRNVADMSFCKLLAVTNGGRPGEEAAMRQFGFDGVLSRPFDISTAVGAIESALGALSA